MSERGQIEVIVPVNTWIRSFQESQEVADAAATAAINLLKQAGAGVGTRVLGVVSCEQSHHPLTDQQAYLIRLECEAPEHVWRAHTARMS